MKLIDHTYGYNSLTNFEYEENEINGNGVFVNLLKLIGKICEITSGGLIFGAFKAYTTYSM